jgi:hypothetical protein
MLAQDGGKPWRDRYGAQAGFSFGRVGAGLPSPDCSVNRLPDPAACFSPPGKYRSTLVPPQMGD